MIEAVHKNKVVFQTGSQQHASSADISARRSSMSGTAASANSRRSASASAIRPVPATCRRKRCRKALTGTRGTGPVSKQGATTRSHSVRREFTSTSRRGASMASLAAVDVADMGAIITSISHNGPCKPILSGPSEIIPPEDKKKNSGLRFVYPSGVVMIHNEFDGGPQADCVFIGSEGTILVSRDGIKGDPESILKEPLGDKAKRVYPSTNHHKNWIECLPQPQGHDLPGGGRPPLGVDLQPGQYRLSIASDVEMGRQGRATFIGDDELRTSCPVAGISAQAVDVVRQFCQELSNV